MFSNVESSNFFQVFAVFPDNILSKQSKNVFKKIICQNSNPNYQMQTIGPQKPEATLAKSRKRDGQPKAEAFASEWVVGVRKK